MPSACTWQWILLGNIKKQSLHYGIRLVFDLPALERVKVSTIRQPRWSITFATIAYGSWHTFSSTRESSPWYPALIAKIPSIRSLRCWTYPFDFLSIQILVSCLTTIWGCSPYAYHVQPILITNSRKSWKILENKAVSNSLNSSK